jgi:hypothetical protein
MIPYIAIDTTDMGEILEKTIECPFCDKFHEIINIQDDRTPSAVSWYKCGNKTYICGINGLNICGINKSDIKEDSKGIDKSFSDFCKELHIPDIQIENTWDDRDNKSDALAFVKKLGNNLQFIKKQTPEICLAAIKNDPFALVYIQEQTSELCLIAVKISGISLPYVREQTPEICLEAVKQNGSALQYVREQTPEICLEAVKNNSWALRYVIKQTIDICYEAINRDSNVIQYIDRSIFKN